MLELVAERAASAPLLVLAFEDVQWLDAASAELLHYVARMSQERPLLVALTARDGELVDNETVRRTLHGLREMGVLEEVPLAPLGPEDTAALVRAVAPGADASRVFAESGGNPLFALEVMRSLPEQGGAPAAFARGPHPPPGRAPAVRGGRRAPLGAPCSGGGSASTGSAS